MDERKRDSIVAYLRNRMAQYGISSEAVAASIAADQARLRSARYRNAEGETWDGNGKAPDWVVQAMSAGQSLDHFAIKEVRDQEPNKALCVDWSGDPFAGTRLATNRAEYAVGA